MHKILNIWRQRKEIQEVAIEHSSNEMEDDLLTAIVFENSMCFETFRRSYHFNDYTGNRSSFPSGNWRFFKYGKFITTDAWQDVLFKRRQSTSSDEYRPACRHNTRFQVYETEKLGVINWLHIFQNSEGRYYIKMEYPTLKRDEVIGLSKYTCE